MRRNISPLNPYSACILDVEKIMNMRKLQQQTNHYTNKGSIQIILICSSATFFFQLINKNTNGMDRPIKALTAMDEVISGSQIEDPKVITSSATIAHKVTQTKPQAIDQNTRNKQHHDNQFIKGQYLHSEHAAII